MIIVHVGIIALQCVVVGISQIDAVINCVRIGIVTSECIVVGIKQIDAVRVRVGIVAAYHVVA